MRHRLPKMSGFLLPIVAFTLGIAGTTVVYRTLSADRESGIADRFRYDASQRAELVVDAFSVYEDALESIGRFFDESTEVSREEFERFASAWVSPRGFSAILWCVPSGGADWLGAGAGLDAQYRVPSLEPSEELAGMLEAPAVRSVAAAAATRGRLSASTMSSLPWTRPLPAIALCRPVFSASDDSGTRRFGALIGFISLPVVVGDVILSGDPMGLPLTIRGTGPDEPEYAYRARVGATAGPGHALGGLSYARELSLADRSWRIEVRASTEYAAAMDRSAEYMAIAGAIASIGLAALTLSLVRGRQSAEAAAAASTAEFELFFTLSLDLFAIAGLDGVFRRLNAEWSAVLGYPLSELEGVSFFGFIHPDDVEATRQVVSGLAAGEACVGFVNRYRARDGSYHSIEWRSRMAPDGDTILAAARDITARVAMEDALRRSLVEKEALIREVHHRVKNNMQVISSLLALDAVDRADPRLVEAAREAQSRIRSMAMVHEQLYRGDSMSEIELGEYLRALAGRVVGEYPRGRAELSVETDPLRLDLDSAIPCGLAINELLTNALKYACEGSAPAVRVRGRATGDSYRILVEDDGPGLPEGALERSLAGETLGLSLVSGLAAQLRGELRLLPGPGARLELRFAYPGREPVTEAANPPS